MFCPKCRAEYRPGFAECADCKVPLVSVLPPEPKAVYIEYEEILSTFNIGDVAISKSLLDKENLTYYFKGGLLQIVRPMVEPARLMVRKDQVQKAIEILKDLDLNYLTFGTGSTRNR
jgi:hypothetical protein